MSVVNAIPLIAAGDDGYNLTRSLRFRSSASAYLNRTFTTPTDGKKWTYSTWVKRGILTAGTGTAQMLLSAGSATGFFRFSTTDTLISGWTGASNLETTAVYRDPAAGYHIMLVVDTTQATAANRVKYYVNGVQVTAFATTDYPTQNSATTINSAVAHNIAAYTSSTQFFDGYMAEVNFIDGQALTPSSFGAFSSYNQWLPKKYAGTYGTNGFYLPFTNNSSTTSLGYDFSTTVYSDNLRSSGTNTGTFTANGGLAAAFDGNTNQPNASSARVSTPAAGYNTAVIGKDWGAGVTKTITAVRLFSQNDGGFVGGTTNALTFKLQGSNDNSAWTDLTSAITGPATGAGTLISVTSGITTTTAYRYHRINVNANGSDNYYMCELEFYEAGTHGFNNWTTNNISVTAGSTYDSTTDVPTLTSATAANYCVLNPLDVTTGVISNANLRFTNSNADHRATRAGIALPSTDKWYYEGTVLSTAGSNVAVFIGACQATQALNVISAATGWSVGGVNSTVRTYDGNASQTPTGSVSAGDVLQVAYDGATGKIWVGKNNTWYDASGGTTGNPSAGTNQMATTSGVLFPWIDCYQNTVDINFGQRPFSYTPPTGYLALNTFNL